MGNSDAQVEPKTYSAVMAADSPAKSKRQRLLSTQIRIRLLPDESLAFEQRRLKELQEGKAYAETFSSWVRYQLEPFIHPVVDREESLISKELHDVAIQHAQTLGMTPDEFIEACILEIIHMACQKRPRLPVIVKGCRTNAASNRAS